MSQVKFKYKTTTDGAIDNNMAPSDILFLEDSHLIWTNRQWFGVQWSGSNPPNLDDYLKISDASTNFIDVSTAHDAFDLSIGRSSEALVTIEQGNKQWQLDFAHGHDGSSIISGTINWYRLPAAGAGIRTIIDGIEAIAPANYKDVVDGCTNLTSGKNLPGMVWSQYNEIEGSNVSLPSGGSFNEAVINNGRVYYYCYPNDMVYWNELDDDDENS